ncbi:dynein axonemal assembly factor 4-like [Solea solea]|uniref:dynein axonemal assembly factor 4-like n=1 Tax=Solea solea TaxID=90069 RepID=UPI00272D8DB7|nr:dynein axonemal assembly factor 4-like [Solea solea]
MPLFVTDYTWTQTDTTVRVHVPLKGAKAARVDVVSTDQYLKVHFPPFLFEVFLFEAVDDGRSSVKIGNGVAIFSLMKKTEKTWDHLMMMSCDKEAKRQMRERALHKHHEKLTALSMSNMETLRARKTFLLETMMKLEREGADRVQKMKDTEREKTMAELEAWQQTRKQTAGEEENDTNNDKDPTERTGSGNMRPGETGSAAAKCKKKEAELPSPRWAGHIGVTFTPRVFPTALRESRVQEEEEWLRKQAETRRSFRTQQEVEDVNEEQQNPDWLKDKGDRCFAAGDYLSAVNAYSAAIRLNPSMAALFSNRAACHLKLRNLHKSIKDSSQALHLMTPPVTANAASRAKAHVRRGAAFCELQLYDQGLQDYEAALKIHPDIEDLHRDTQTIRDMMKGHVTHTHTIK